MDEGLRELGVEPELVDLVLPGDPPSQEPECASDPFIPDVRRGRPREVRARDLGLSRSARALRPACSALVPAVAGRLEYRSAHR